jgi:YVTN family beta-propeller protein
MLPAMTRRPRRSHRLAVLALTAVLALAGCASDEPGTAATSAATPSASTTPSATGPADLATQVTGPIGLAAVGDAVWAVSSDQDAVVRIDPATGQVSSTVEVGDTPLRLAADGDLLWVSVFRAGRVVAVDTESGEIAHDVELGDGPEGVAVGHGAVWVVRQDAAELTRLSKTGKVLGHTPLGDQPRLGGQLRRRNPDAGPAGRIRRQDLGQDL